MAFPTERAWRWRRCAMRLRASDRSFSTRPIRRRSTPTRRAPPASKRRSRICFRPATATSIATAAIRTSNIPIFEQIEWLNVRPLPVTVSDPRNGQPFTIDVTGRALVEITRWALAFEDARYALPAYLDAISSVDPAILEPAVAGMVDGYLGLGSDDMSEGKYFAVECVEEMPFNDAALVQQMQIEASSVRRLRLPVRRPVGLRCMAEADARSEPEGADQEQHPDAGPVGPAGPHHARRVRADHREPVAEFLSRRGSRPGPFAALELQMRREDHREVSRQSKDRARPGMPEEAVIAPALLP